MEKKFITLFFGIAFCVIFTSLRAQNDDFPSYAQVKGKMVISQFHTVDKPHTPEGIFLNALLWVIENREEPEEEKRLLIKTDYDKKQFEVQMVQTNPETASRYRYLLSVKVADNIITMLVSNITCETEAAVIKLVKRLPFEKLQPDKKPKHREYLDEFAALCKASSAQMLKAIAGNEPPVVTHWAEIKEKSVAKGMSEAECTLAMGKPASVQKQGAKTEWMYDAYTYLFFENGILTSFIK